MTQLSEAKQNINKHKDKSCNLKKHKVKLKAQLGWMNGLNELFLLTCAVIICWHFASTKTCFSASNAAQSIMGISREKAARLCSCNKSCKNVLLRNFDINYRFIHNSSICRLRLKTNLFRRRSFATIGQPFIIDATYCLSKKIFVQFIVHCRNWTA